MPEEHSLEIEVKFQEELVKRLKSNGYDINLVDPSDIVNPYYLSNITCRETGEVVGSLHREIVDRELYSKWKIIFLEDLRNISELLKRYESEKRMFEPRNTYTLPYIIKLTFDEGNSKITEIVNGCLKNFDITPERQRCILSLNQIPTTVVYYEMHYHFRQMTPH